jgi:anti-sigma B factor antagonist
MTAEASKSPVRRVRWSDGSAIVDVAGDVDLSRSAAFQRSLLEVVDRRPERIIVNLADVGYMDSSGVASLVKLLSRARRIDLPICLVGMRERVRSIFEITRLDSVFDIYATEQEALA